MCCCEEEMCEAQFISCSEEDKEASLGYVKKDRPVQF